MTDDTSPPPVDRRYKSFREAIDGAYWAGFEHGEEAGHRIAREGLRAEIADELKDEMERFDPDCALCIARRRLDELEETNGHHQAQVDGLVSQRRGWMIRKH